MSNDDVKCCESCKQPLPKVTEVSPITKSIWQADDEFAAIAKYVNKTRCYSGQAMTAIRFLRNISTWNILKDDKAALLPYVSVKRGRRTNTHTMFYHQGKFFSDTLKQDIDFVREPLTKVVG